MLFPSFSVYLPCVFFGLILVDLFGVHFGCPNLSRTRFTYFINSLVNTTKVQNKVGNSVSEAGEGVEDWPDHLKRTSN